MTVALDPFMHRHLSLENLPSKVAELGYERIELSLRGDFLEWFKAPRVFPDRVKGFKKALSDANVGIASLLPMYRWASNDEDERGAAVKYWKRAIEIAVEMGVDTMNLEFGRGPHPDKGTCHCCHTGSMVEACEDAWWRSMEELVPILEREGGNLRDPILGVMEMAGGAVVTVEVSVNIGYGYDIRGEISGETGTAELAELNRVVLKSGDSFAGRMPADWRERFNDAYDTEVRGFIDAAATGDVSGPSAWDSYTIQVVSDAGIKAVATGETVSIITIDKAELHS